MLQPRGSAAIVLKFPGGKFDPLLFPVIVDENGNVVVDMSKEYAKYKEKYGTYVNAAEQILKDLEAKKALEVLNAVQDSNGVIHINMGKKPKLQKWLKVLRTVGTIAVPIILSAL